MSLIPDKDICGVCDGFLGCGTESSRCRCKTWQCKGCGLCYQSPTKPNECSGCKCENLEEVSHVL